MEKNKQKEFKIFLKKIEFAYSNFCIWRALQNKKYNLVYDVNKYFWNNVIVSLNNSSITELSKLLEKPNNFCDNENLTIFYLLGEMVEFDITILNKLKKLRNKILGHNDKKTLLDGERFMKELNLTDNDVNCLFQKIIGVLDGIKDKFNNTIDCKRHFEIIKQSCEDEVKNFMSEKIKLNDVKIISL